MSKLYDGPVIDPHHHLWDLSLGRHPWLAPQPGKEHSLGDLARLRRNYLIEDYLVDSGGQNVVATVHVEAAWIEEDCLGETRWLEALDKQRGVASRYVAHVPLNSPEAPALIAAQASFARVVGIRDILSWHRNPALTFAERGDVMDDPAWRRGLARLAEHDLVFDLMIFAGQLGDALRLAQAFPNQLFVLNHCGSPIDRDEDSMAAWRAGVKALASAENVAIKISGLTGYDPHWTLESLRPLILHCIESFGPQRSMMASDFPVTSLHASFAQSYEVYRAVAGQFSASDQRALFFDTAKRIYKFPVEN
ncbi:MAG: amidohydrolase family protein [Roseiarcus sp.]|jgi:predicted TIM-barrel fold metal-dependent hydrolase